MDDDADAVDVWCEGHQVLDSTPWQPDDPVVRFAAAFERRLYGKEAVQHHESFDFERLHRLSVEHDADFYRTFIDFAGIRLYDDTGAPVTDTNVPITNREATLQLETACRGTRIGTGASQNDNESSSPVHSHTRTTVGTMPITGLRWLPNIRVNYAENILRNPQASIVFRSEPGSGIPRRELSYRQLYAWVARVAEALEQQLHLSCGEHVVGFLPNIPETIIAMLAVTSLGGIWASCSPDFGEDAAVDRFGQLQPRLLITADAVVFKGKRHDCLKKAQKIASRLGTEKRNENNEENAVTGIPVWIVPYGCPRDALVEHLDAPNWQCFPSASPEPAVDEALPAIPFRRIRFDRDPVVTMFSSGTTGRPKCMAQGAGILLTQEKEQLLHYAMGPEHTLFFYTTCGWMMWNWSVAALARGCRLILYDGAAVWSSLEHPASVEAGAPENTQSTPRDTDPSLSTGYAPQDALWRIVAEEQVTHFGCGAKFLQIQEQLGVHPARWSLGRLQAVLVTGSPSTVANFRYVWARVGRHVRYWSMSGGTDINGCFALGLQRRAVYAGELQSCALGLGVQVFDAHGHPVENQDGELVCTNACPSMPLFFWNDTTDASMYRSAYFRTFGETVWHHGDYARVVVREPGHERSLIIRGRSDATLKPGGVRLGSADFYTVLERMPEVSDSLVAGQRWHDDVRIILFVKLAHEAPLGPLEDSELRSRIVNRLRQSLSPRHVPHTVIVVPGIPYTRNMKKMEVAVKRILDDEPLDNTHACMDPELLETYRELKRKYLARG